MSYQELIEEFKKLDYDNRENFLDWIQSEYFDNGITPEQKLEFSRIIGLYYDGLLVEVEDEY